MPWLGPRWQQASGSAILNEGVVGPPPPRRADDILAQLDQVEAALPRARDRLGQICRLLHRKATLERALATAGTGGRVRSAP